MTPKIDYTLLGRAVSYYQKMGFRYVEVPWAVHDEFIEATLDSEARSVLIESKGIQYPQTRSVLVGSAEQGFLSMDLPPGRYVGCTPCFRIEDEYNTLYQRWFMKVELFDSQTPMDWRLMMDMARTFMWHETTAPIVAVETDIGCDLEINGIEVGSYGARSVDGFVPWAYGTGLALPRFSVATGTDFFRQS